MTTEIEKEFFKAFEIEPKRNQQTTSGLSGIPLPDFHPEITDSNLLELICIESQVNKANNTYSDVENLKEHILVGLRPFTEKCYHQVRKLFEVEKQ